jgi:two-component sensor histidine kinase
MKADCRPKCFDLIFRNDCSAQRERRPSQQLRVPQMVRQLFGWWRAIWVGGLQPGSIASLLFALACVVIATLIRIALGELSAASTVFASYYSATLVAALVGGVSAGTLAAVSGALAGFWLFVPPDWKSHVFDQDQLVSAVLFAGSSAVIIWAAKSYRDLLRRLREGEEQRQLLTHELAHRIRNTLSIVQSLISQTLRDQPAAFSKLSARIAALAATNDLLIKSEWRGACLKEILAGEFAPYDPAQFRLDGEDFACASELATVLALIFHELTTNAAKYGALSTPRGIVTLAWRKHDGHMDFSWVESGGPQPATSRRQGFGTTLLRKGLRQFDGSVAMEFVRDGLHCRFSLALPGPTRTGSTDTSSPQQPMPTAAVENAPLVLHPRRIAEQK